MKKLLVVFTGGTIGSAAADGVIDTDPGAGRKLLHMFRAADPLADRVSFTAIQPLRILSENLQPGHWSGLIAAIEALDLAQFAGVVVTHGTDTLAFSAAALGLYFNALPLPLLMVSSDLPLDNPRANGLPNFIAAVRFILQVGAPGVFVSYQNPGRELAIYRATSLGACLPLSADFHGVGRYVAARLTADGFIDVRVEAAAGWPKPLRADFSKRILLIRPYPGLDYRYFDVSGVDAVLHDAYHSGTACSSAEFGGHTALPAFVEYCRGLEIPVYLAAAPSTEDCYQTTRDLLASGARVLWNTPLEAAYAKLLLAYANFNDADELADFLRQNVAGEVLPAG